MDGVTVTTADGRGVVYRQRDRAKALQLLRESRALQRELKERFDDMRAHYRGAHRELTSADSWQRVFSAGEKA